MYLHSHYQFLFLFVIILVLYNKYKSQNIVFTSLVPSDMDVISSPTDSIDKFIEEVDECSLLLSDSIKNVHKGMHIQPAEMLLQRSLKISKFVNIIRTN